MPIIKIRPLAEQDIFAGTRYLELHAGFDVAERFFTAIWAEFESLSKMPQIGYLCNFKNNQMRDIRRWPVRGFERWLIFYQALAPASM